MRKELTFALRPITASLARCSSAAAVGAALAMACATQVQAQTLNWDPAGNQSNSGGSGTWNLSSLFWNDDNVPPNVAWSNANPRIAVFGGTGGLVTINTGGAGSGVVANGLVFNVSGYEINSSAFSDVLQLAGPSSVNVATAGHLATINAVIGGTDGLTKIGNGTLALTNANVFTGGVTVNAGTLNFTDDAQLGDLANGILLNGGRIDYTGGVDWNPSSTRIITIGAGGGTISSSIAVRINDAGQITGAGTLIREGSGTNVGLDITSANPDFTGNVVVNSSTLEIKNNGAIGLGDGQTVTVNGGLLSVAGNTGSIGAVILPHAVNLNGGGIAFNNQIGGSYAGPVNVSAASSISLQNFYNNLNYGGTIAGVLSGSGALAVTGALGNTGANAPYGSVLLTNGGNTYSGTINIGPAAQVRSIQGGGVDALASARIELSGGVLGIAPKPVAAGANEGFFGRYYNSPKIGNGVIGGFDFGTEPMVHSRNDATVNYTSTIPTAPGLNATNIGVLWTGILEVTSPGSYQFFTRSDDGSMLYVDGMLVAANDVGQGATERSGAINLSAGFHSIIMKYGQGTGGAAISANYTGPDTFNVKTILGSLPNTLTNNGGALFPATTMDNNIDVLGTATAYTGIDLAGADATSAGTMTFASGAGLRITGVTGFETLTQSGPVVLNGSNILQAGFPLTGNLANTHNYESAGADMIITGNITEAAPGSGIIKDGPRKVTLRGTNSFTGPITINTGTLAGGGAQFPSTIPVTVNAGGTLEFNQLTNGTFTGSVTGAGAVRKSGPGALSVNSSINTTGVTTVAGGLLTGTDSVAGPVVVQSGGAIGGTTGSTFTVGSLRIGMDGGLNAALTAPNLTPLITTNGALSFNGGQVNVTDAGGLAAGTYRLIDYSGTPLTTAQLSGLRIGDTPNLPFYFALLNNGAATAVDLSVEAFGALNTWTGASSNIWTPGDASNWSTAYANGQQVTFNDAGANKNITGPAVAPQRIVVTNSAGNDYTIANAITGTLAGGLEKNGTGTLTLTGANTFTGDVTLNGGTLRANATSAGSSLGAGPVTVAAGTTLQLTPTASTIENGLSSRYFSTTPDATTNGQTNLTVFNFTLPAAVLQTDTNFDPAAYTEANLPAGGLVGYDESTANTSWKNFAIERTGKISIPTRGWYGFHTFSDDGTRIFIDGRLVADANGGHGNVEGNGTVFLEPGLHDFRYQFIQGTGGADEQISWSGPGISKQVLPASAVFTAENASLAGADNFINLGTAITAAGSTTIALPGADFTGVQVGSLETNGGTITVTGQATKRFRIGTTVLNSSIILEHTPDMLLGRVDDLGSAVTITKRGPGQLVFDNTAGGADASQISPGTILLVQNGTLVVIGSNVAGSLNPIGSATVNLDGGDLTFDSVVGSMTYGNPVNVQRSARINVLPVGHTTALTGGLTIGTGQTLTLNVSGGSRGSSGNATIAGQAVPGATLNVASQINGDGDLVIESVQTTGAQAPIGGTVFLRQPLNYTGLTTIKGYFGGHTIVDVRGQAALLSTTGINAPGRIDLTNVRLNIHNGDGGNLANRLPDEFPVTMHSSTIRHDGAGGTSATERLGPLTLASGQNNLFGGNASGSAFATLSFPSVTRQNRSTLRIDGANLTNVFAATGVRFIFDDPSGFTDAMVGGDGANFTNGKIIPWVWGAPTGNNRSFGTYDFNGLRLLADSEYSLFEFSTDPQDNIRQTFVGNTTVPVTGVVTANSLVVANTGTTDATLTLQQGTVVNVTSGALMLTTTDGTARRVTLAGGFINFGNAEGVIVTSRREHLITSVLSGTNGLTISGDGQLTLNQPLNDFIGPIHVGNAGSPVSGAVGLFVQDDESLGNSDNDLFLDGSSFRFNAAFTMNANRTVTLSPAGGAIDTNNLNVAIAGQVTGPGGLIKTNGNTLRLTNTANNYQGETHILSGNLITNTGPQGDIHHNSATNGNLTFEQLFDGTYAGKIDGVGNVIKSGNGAVTFTGHHTYVGTTTLTGGALIVNGSIGGSTTFVNLGTLGGTGSIAYDVILGNNVGSGDSVLSPGSGGIGTLTTGKMTFNVDSAFKLELNSTSRTTDLLASTDEISLGLGRALLTVSDLGNTALPIGERFTFITAADGLTGTFANLPNGGALTVGPNIYSINYAPNSVSLVVIPEPSALTALLGGAGLLAGLRRFRRRSA